MKTILLSFLFIQLIAINSCIEDNEIEYYYKDYIKNLGYKLEENEVI